MVYTLVHYFVIGFYLTAPVGALAVDATISIRRRSGAPSSSFVLTTTAAVVIGASLALIYALGIGGRVSLWQIFLCIYFAAGLLLLLKAFDWIILRGTDRLVLRRIRSERPWPRRTALAGQSILRVALLVGVGLPYIMASIMTYRPRVVPRDDPMTLFKIPFQPVSFESTDGVRLAGWWVPAVVNPRGGQADRTVIVCHGLASNKAQALIMARQLILDGYNALIFDFRAHGESGGQLTSMGDLERRDVLGAVQWLRDQRPEQSRRIVGVGASMGAAALIGAAADESELGQAIEAVAVYGTFDDLRVLARDVAHGGFYPPFDRLLPTLGLRFAAAQVGADLPRFRPADEVVRLWPRPILIIHGQQDRIIPFERGVRLWREAMHPKQHLWLLEGGHNQIIEDDNTTRQVREFFNAARAVQML